jgi:phosphoribosylanthranilate isomerase
MKKNVFKIALVSMILIGLVACKNKEKELAEKRISELENYVDSLKSVAAFENETNWEKISEDFERKQSNANDALTSLDDETKMTSKAKITASTIKYGEYKTNIETNKSATTKPNASQILRDRLFGAGKIGTDMSFAWVNKNNILSVYTNFFQSYKDLKSNFSREDYDEIKLMYEALDSRKNTVEKEGLSSSDNNKIAMIKLKFSPMFKVNRMSAKSKETAESKE